MLPICRCVTNAPPPLWLSLVQTAKDETAYTQVSDKPDEPSQTPANQPTRNGSYIAMSPVEAQKCWSWFPLPEAQEKGAEGSSTWVLYCHGWVWCAHSWLIFTYSWGWGGTQAPGNADTAPLTEPSLMTVCPPLIHLLSMALTATQPNSHTLPVLVGPKHEGTLDGLLWGNMLAHVSCTSFGADSADQRGLKRARLIRRASSHLPCCVRRTLEADRFKRKRNKKPHVNCFCFVFCFFGLWGLRLNWFC